MTTRRDYFSKLSAIMAALAGGRMMWGQQTATTPKSATAVVPSRPDRHVANSIYYFSGTGANDGYPKDDHVFVSDPFEKHVTRTMDALKKSLERSGCTMDSILHLEVFLCLPLADNVPSLTGKNRFDAHKEQYDTLNKIYHTYFSPGKAPSRACMAVEWIPGDSLIEIAGSAAVVNPLNDSSRE